MASLKRAYDDDDDDEEEEEGDNIQAAAYNEFLDDLIQDDDDEEEQDDEEKPVLAFYEDDDEYFFVNDPQSVIDGIGRTEYNFAKGAITGPILLAIAPFALAILHAHGHETHLQATSGCIIGFFKGILRGVAGCTALVGAGTVHGVNQFRKGILEAEDALGQGHGVQENVEHILNEPFLHLITNTESVTFKDDVAKLGEKGTKAKYLFFITDKPKDFITGFLTGQYNILKGCFAGATLAVCAPFKDSYCGFNSNGWAGGVRGLGSGISRGLIGGLAIYATGLVTGIYQLLCGVENLDIPQAVKGCEAVHKDLSKLVRTPIVTLISSKEYLRTRRNVINVLNEDERLLQRNR